MQRTRKEKILHLLSLSMAARTVAEAGVEEVREALKLVVPKSYDPFFHMMEDMDTFKRDLLGGAVILLKEMNLCVRIIISEA